MGAGVAVATAQPARPAPHYTATVTSDCTALCYRVWMDERAGGGGEDRSSGGLASWPPAASIYIAVLAVGCWPAGSSPFSTAWTVIVTFRHYPARVGEMGDRANVMLAARPLHRSVLLTKPAPCQPATRSRRRAGPTWPGEVLSLVRLQAGTGGGLTATASQDTAVPQLGGEAGGEDREGAGRTAVATSSPGIAITGGASGEGAATTATGLQLGGGAAEEEGSGGTTDQDGAGGASTATATPLASPHCGRGAGDSGPGHPPPRQHHRRGGQGQD